MALPEVLTPYNQPQGAALAGLLGTADFPKRPHPHPLIEPCSQTYRRMNYAQTFLRPV